MGNRLRDMKIEIRHGETHSVFYVIDEVEDEILCSFRSREAAERYIDRQKSGRYDWLAGRRIRLLAMPDDPDPIPVGSEGTVICSTAADEDEIMSVEVDWDNGRRRMLCVPPDRYRLIN